MEITSGVRQTAIKCVVYGPEGVGKSTFASLAPNPLWCDVEDSTAFMNVRRLPKPNSLQAIIEEIQYVKANLHVCDTFVLDTADWAEKLCHQYICAANNKRSIEDFGYGKGFTMAYEVFGRLLNALDELIGCGINVIVTAHAAMRRVELPDEDGSYDRWELKLCNSQKCSVAGMLKEWADIVLFANYKTYVIKKDSKDKNGKAKGGQQRVMYTTHHACWDAKNRHGLADELPFDFGQVAHLFLAKSAAQDVKKALAQNAVACKTPHQSAAPTASPQGEAFGMCKPEMPEKATEGRPYSEGAVSELGAEAMLRATDGAEAASSDDRYAKVYPFDEVLPDGIIAPLADLMRMHSVMQAELQGVVAQKGYFPADVPVASYPQDFQNFLTTVWPQVLDIIKTNRTKEN